MSKEMKMSDVSCDVTFVDYVANAVKNHDYLFEENATLREQLRLKEAECETLTGKIKQLNEGHQEMIRLLSRIHASSGDVFGDQRSFKWENLAFDRCSIENLLYRVKGK